jgi:hypothetical protein
MPFLPPLSFVPVRKMYMKTMCAFALCISVCGAVCAASFDDIAKEMLSKDVRAALRGTAVVINTTPDAPSADFAEAFRNALKKDATVVLTDRSITKKELQRQESSVVDDKEIARYGREKGAEIVIQVILYRIPRDKKIKFVMTAVWVESNTLAASNVLIKSIPSSYNTDALPLQGGDAAAAVKNMTNGIVSSKVKGIYDDPVKPPPPTKPPKKPIQLPKLDFSKLTDDCWIGGNISWLTYYHRNTGEDVTPVKIGFEYGRNCSGWNIQDRWCAEISFLCTAAVGLDFNAGYQLLPFDDFWLDEWVWYSCIAAAGFSLLTENDISSFIPYLQLSAHIAVFQVSIRLLPFTQNAKWGVQGGLCYKWAF